MLTRIEIEIDMTDVISYVRLLDQQWKPSFLLYLDVEEGESEFDPESFKEGFAVFALHVAEACFNNGMEFEMFRSKFYEQIRGIFSDRERWSEVI